MCVLVPCSTKDQIVMVNAVSMDNVYSTYTIQTLKTCGKTVNVVSMKETSTKTPKGFDMLLLQVKTAFS